MAKPDALRRLGGGRWETKDGRFQIEPQSGTWVIVDTTQENEFGLPLVRGPYPSLGAAREAIDSAREAGPVESPLADRIEQARREAPTPPAASTPAKKVAPPAEHPTPLAEPKTPTEPKAPPEPAWLRPLQAGDRRRAKELIARLEALGIVDAEVIARAEIVEREPALARLALARRLGAIATSTTGSRDAVAAAIEVILSGEDPDLGATWRLVDEHGRRIEDLDVGD